MYPCLRLNECDGFRLDKAAQGPEQFGPAMGRQGPCTGVSLLTMPQWWCTHGGWPPAWFKQQSNLDVGVCSLSAILWPIHPVTTGHRSLPNTSGLPPHLCLEWDDQWCTSAVRLGIVHHVPWMLHKTNFSTNIDKSKFCAVPQCYMLWI